MAGQLKKTIENKWIDRGLKQGAGWANLRKNDKMNRLVGAKTRGLVANLRKKEKTNGLEGAKNRGRGRPTKGK